MQNRPHQRGLSALKRFNCALDTPRLNSLIRSFSAAIASASTVTITSSSSIEYPRSQACQVLLCSRTSRPSGRLLSVHDRRFQNGPANKARDLGDSPLHYGSPSDCLAHRLHGGLRTRRDLDHVPARCARGRGIRPPPAEMRAGFRLKGRHTRDKLRC